MAGINAIYPKNGKYFLAIILDINAAKKRDGIHYNKKAINLF